MKKYIVNGKSGQASAVALMNHPLEDAASSSGQFSRTTTSQKCKAVPKRARIQGS